MPSHSTKAAILAAALTLSLTALADATEVVQNGNLRVTASAKMTPSALPRSGAAPISVSVSGLVSTTDSTAPPQLRKLTIEINRHGRIEEAGLPVCPIGRIQPASTSRALSACRSSLVGQGRFFANTSLSGGMPYPTQGRLLLFNGREGGRPVLFGHIYATQPFTSSYVIPFRIRQLPHGTYGTELSADLARSLNSRENLTGIEMTLSRRYSYRGARHSYLSAACPAPKGFREVLFPLARASFAFPGKTLTSTLARTCRARG